MTVVSMVACMLNTSDDLPVTYDVQHVVVRLYLGEKKFGDSLVIVLSRQFRIHFLVIP